MMITKKLFFTTIVIMLAVVNMHAQKIEVVDKDGRGIPFVSVLNEEGSFIGETNLAGILPNVKNAQELTLINVGYKPQQVSDSAIQDGRITMEEFEYNLPEINMQLKPFFFVEYYYRVYAFQRGSLYYYISGIMPVAYELGNKKEKIGRYKDCNGEFNKHYGQKESVLKLFMIHVASKTFLIPQGLQQKELKKMYTVATKVENDGRLRIYNPRETVGYIINTPDQTRISVDLIKMGSYAGLGNNGTKIQYTGIARRNEDGNTEIFDTKMFSNQFRLEIGFEKMKVIVETYVVKRSFIDSQDFKVRQKELARQYKAPLSLDQLETYATEHHIPSLTPTLRRTIESLNAK